MTLAACSPSDEPGETDALEAVDVADFALDEAPIEASRVEPQPEQEVIYQLTRILDVEGTELERTETGAMDRHQWRKAARPDPAIDGEHLYREHAQTEELDDGRVRSTVTLTRTLNAAGQDTEVERPPKMELLDPLVVDEAGLVHVALQLSGYPPWAPPFRLPPGTFSEEEEAAGSRERAAWLRDREHLFGELRGSLDELITATGGRSDESSWTSGWVGARVPVVQLDRFIDSDLVDHITSLDRESHDAWYLGEAGDAARYNAVALTASGYVGDETTIGIIERGYLNDEVCFKFNSSGCTGVSRLAAAYDCQNPAPFLGNDCDLVSNLADEAYSDGGVSHATIVTSIAAGDYDDGQGTGHELGDSAWTSGAHSADWERRASSLAPEVAFWFAGGAASDAKAAQSVSVMNLGDPQIVNMSFWNGATRCTASAVGQAFDQAIEDAFDDGVFMVIAGGNDPDGDGDAFGPCDLVDQAGLPKAFAVNAVAPGCDGNYQTGCLLSVPAAGNGGIDATTPDNVVRAGALSGVSIAAADGNSRATDIDCDNPSSSVGRVPEGGLGCGSFLSGSSFAAPAVTSVAVDVREWGSVFLGATSIAGVGRLHTVMLGMADSHYMAWGASTTTQRTTRADRRFGMGRLKVKRPLRTILTTATLTASASQYSSWVGATPLASTHDMVKCVALQHEDMSSKTKINDVTLRVEVWNPAGSTCTTSNPPYTYVDDTSYDIKSMVARRSGVAGKCVRATLHANALVGSSVNVSLYCYASTDYDDEPN